jgi:hypothetical protein
MPTLPKFPSGQEIYDSIMQKIEPELVSASLPILNEKYKDESPKDKEARKKRYNLAFLKYNKEFKAYMVKLQVQANQYYKDVRLSLEEKSREKETKDLSSIESQIQSA